MRFSKQIQMIAYVMTDPPTYCAAANSPQCVYIEDVGSMHGTYVDEKRVTAHERHRLYSEDLVKFGNEVTRGPGMSPFSHA
jgi:FHA domain